MAGFPSGVEQGSAVTRHSPAEENDLLNLHGYDEAELHLRGVEPYLE